MCYYIRQQIVIKKGHILQNDNLKKSLLLITDSAECWVSVKEHHMEIIDGMQHLQEKDHFGFKFLFMLFVLMLACLHKITYVVTQDLLWRWYPVLQHKGHLLSILFKICKCHANAKKNHLNVCGTAWKNCVETVQSLTEKETHRGAGSSPLSNSSGSGRHWGCGTYSIQIKMSGRMEGYRAGSH
jgi:hypothetical protein